MTSDDSAGGDSAGDDSAGGDRALAAVAEAVAAAVGLQEGEAGVRRILAAIHRLAPAPTRAVSRHTGIPVPLVTAVGNELRARGILTNDRPARLTAGGAALLTAGGAVLLAAEAAAAIEPWCGGCDGSGLVVPAQLRPAADRLVRAMAQAPAVDVSLDQSYATVETKLRRVALMLGLGILPAQRVLVVGDDDLMSLSLVAAGEALGMPLVRELAVVEISPPLLALLGQVAPGQIEVHAHDLRDRLPAPLRGRFEVAVTDPPYTVEGARLFLSRAVEGLRPGPSRSVVFSFGAKGPADGLALQRAITDIGLTVQAAYRGFNEYLGSGVLAGTSHLYWLATTAATASTVPGRHPGGFYTAELRSGRTRRYRCLACGTGTAVGPGACWASVRQLQAAGCPGCGGRRFRPLGLVRA